MFAEDRNSQSPCDSDDFAGIELTLDEAVILVGHYLEIQESFPPDGGVAPEYIHAHRRINYLIVAGAISLARARELDRSTSEDPDEASGAEPAEAGRHQSGLADGIRAAILKSGRAPYQIAREAGVPRTIVLQFLNEKQGMTLDAAERICQVLGLNGKGM